MVVLPKETAKKMKCRKLEPVHCVGIQMPHIGKVQNEDTKVKKCQGFVQYTPPHDSENIALSFWLPTNRLEGINKFKKIER